MSRQPNRVAGSVDPGLRSPRRQCESNARCCLRRENARSAGGPEAYVLCSGYGELVTGYLHYIVREGGHAEAGAL